MESEIYTNDIDLIYPIERIDFDILGNDEIKRISAFGYDSIGISVIDLYDNSEPNKDGLIDSRMGTVSNDRNCATCGLSTLYCVGHSAHITLAEHVFHIGYLQYVYKILSCICIHCSKLLIHKKESQIKNILKYKSTRDRINYIKKISKNINNCQTSNSGYGCGAPTSIIKIDKKKKNGFIHIIAENKFENKEQFNDETKFKLKQKLLMSPELVFEILSHISDEDCQIMGIDPSRSRPCDMIHKEFLVPPVQIRPSVRGDFSGGVSENDLTHKLADILKNNIRILKNKETNNENSIKYHSEYIKLLQYHTATYHDNDSLLLLKSERRDRQIQSLSARLKGKTGRIRNNLMGKRGDFTARTVITPEPNSEIGYLRVPLQIAKNLTFPETVTQYNMLYLTELVSRGRDNYPGANFVFPINKISRGKRILPVDLRYRKGINLQHGDIVERHLIDEDIVLLNRQPTLHKQSMMAFKIKVINDPNLLTFGFSVAVTTPFGADFDGDEMNIFIPQTIQTQIELEEMAFVEKQIISPGKSSTMIGLKQDALLGAYNITSPNIKINWRSAMNLISYVNIGTKISIKKKDMLGIDMVSLIIPSKINIDMPSIKIINGKIINGRLSDKTLGSGEKNTIIQNIWNIYGSKETNKFITNVHRLTNNFNSLHGFTVGMGDIERKKEIIAQINVLINTKRNEIEHLITEIENNPELMGMDILEYTLYTKSKGINDGVQKIIVGNLSNENGFKIMHISGAKGKADNIGQIMGCLGLQAFENKIIPKKYNNRTSPYYLQNDDSLESRGVVTNSLSDGLDYSQFIFLMLTGGRAGLIEQAVKTGETGYTQRKLIKALEDVMIKYDCSVRNANNSIIQFVYGDSGTDMIGQHNYNIYLLEMGNEKLESAYKFTSDEMKFYPSFDNNLMIKNLKTMRDELRSHIRSARGEYKSIINNFMIPIDINNIVNQLQNDKKGDFDIKLTPEYVLEKLNKLMNNDETQLVYISKKSEKTSLKNKDDNVHKTLLEVALHCAFSPRKIIFEYKMSKSGFDELIANMSRVFEKNMVEPGEMVGIASATSIGEPLTQMTISSFHQSGVMRKNTTAGGIPRIRELFSVSKNIDTSQMTLYLKDEVKDKTNLINKIAYDLKYTLFDEIREKIDVYYDPNATFDGELSKKDNIIPVTFSSDDDSNDGCQSNISTLQWLLRIEINREKMIEKEINLVDITSSFCKWWENKHVNLKNNKKEERKVLSKITRLAVFSNSDNDIVPTIHIRFNVKDNDKDKFDLSTIDDFIVHIVDKFRLKGLNNINDVTVIPDEKSIIYDAESGESKNINESVIYTNGTNLIDIRYNDYIDLNKIISNDVVEMYNIYGIEIARMVLINEISEAFEKTGNDINYQHIELICDLMTMSGSITSIDRHGLHKSDADVLSKVSFEKPVEQLWAAAVFGESDHMRGVSSRIMAGALIRGGTGLCDLSLNTQMIENIKTEVIQNTNFVDVQQNSIIADVSKGGSLEMGFFVE